MYKVGDKVETPFGIGIVVGKRVAMRHDDIIFEVEIKGIKIDFRNTQVTPYQSAHDKLLAMGLRLKITKNYADGVFSHEWWDENDDRVIVFYIDEKVTTVYEGSNEIMDIIPQYLEELEAKEE